MPQKKAKYKYDGPVYKSGKYLCDWQGETWAVSDSKALANLAYRFKTQNALLPGASIKLDFDYLYEISAVDDSYELYHQMILDDLMED